MRPVRFFIALLFGAAVLITFLKLLFFAVFAFFAVGALYFLFRTMRYAMIGRQMSRAYDAPYSYGLSAHEWSGASIQPLDPRAVQPFERSTLGRRIEVSA